TESDDAGLYLTYANKQSNRDSRSAGQADDGVELAFGKGESEARSHAVGAFANEAMALVLFPAEGFHHTHGAQNFLNNAHRGFFERLDFPGAAPEPAAIMFRGQIENGRNYESNQGQLPVDSQGDVQHAEHGEGRVEKGDQVVHHECLNRGSMVLQVVKRFGGSFDLVIGERELLHLTKKLGAKIEEDFFPGVGAEQRNR